jgi:hypothetical protein
MGLIKNLFLRAVYTLYVQPSYVISHRRISKIDTKSIRKELEKENLNGCFISMVDRSENVIKFTDIDSSSEYEIYGGEISNEIYEGLEIRL